MSLKKKGGVEKKVSVIWELQRGRVIKKKTKRDYVEAQVIR